MNRMVMVAIISCISITVINAAQRTIPQRRSSSSDVTTVSRSRTPSPDHARNGGAEQKYSVLNVFFNSLSILRKKQQEKECGDLFWQKVWLCAQQRVPYVAGSGLLATLPTMLDYCTGRQCTLGKPLSYIMYGVGGLCFVGSTCLALQDILGAWVDFRFCMLSRDIAGTFENMGNVLEQIDPQRQKEELQKINEDIVALKTRIEVLSEQQRRLSDHSDQLREQDEELKRAEAQIQDIMSRCGAHQTKVELILKQVADNQGQISALEGSMKELPQNCQSVVTNQSKFNRDFEAFLKETALLLQEFRGSVAKLSPTTERRALLLVESAKQFQRPLYGRKTISGQSSASSSRVPSPLSLPRRLASAEQQEKEQFDS